MFFLRPRSCLCPKPSGALKYARYRLGADSLDLRLGFIACKEREMCNMSEGEVGSCW